MTTKDRELNKIGQAAYASIAEMVAAIQCDYDRRDELAEELADLQAEADENPAALAAWNEENADELKELNDAAGECTNHDDAIQRIYDDPLSIQIRSEWHAPGETPEPGNGEFEILLTTGGPAARIRGELENNEPRRAWLEVQDWGTPWTQYFDADHDTLLEYCRTFCWDNA